MKTSVEFEGLKELDDRLEALSNEFAGKVLYSGLMNASTPMLNEAKQRAPVAPSAYKRYMSHAQGQGKIKGKFVRAAPGTANYVIKEPGTLKNAIRRRRLTKGVRSGDNTGASVAIYVRIPRGSSTFNSPYYWYFHEYGTKYMPARPFFRPAFDNNKEVSLKRFVKFTKKRLEKYEGLDK